ncbi:MAG: zinc ribbon domain-containing protein [Opitutales bacterium]
MFCKECGTKIDDNAKFCPDCGTKLGGNATSGASQGNIEVIGNSGTQDKGAMASLGDTLSSMGYRSGGVGAGGAFALLACILLNFCEMPFIASFVIAFLIAGASVLFFDACLKAAGKE